LPHFSPIGCFEAKYLVSLLTIKYVCFYSKTSLFPNPIQKESSDNLEQCNDSSTNDSSSRDKDLSRGRRRSRGETSDGGEGGERGEEAGERGERGKEASEGGEEAGERTESSGNQHDEEGKSEGNLLNVHVAVVASFQKKISDYRGF
jgi:hypothetical protein